MCKIEELLEREQSEEKCPRVLYRGDWLQRSGCRCSGLVSKYAQRVCRQLGELSVKGDDLLEQIKPILKRCLQGLSWWDKMKDPKKLGEPPKKPKKITPCFAMANLVRYTKIITKNEAVIWVYCSKSLSH